MESITSIDQNIFNLLPLHVKFSTSPILIAFIDNEILYSNVQCTMLILLILRPKSMAKGILAVGEMFFYLPISLKLHFFP